MKLCCSVGYDPVLDRLEKASNYLMSCYNCRYYYKTKADDCEVCQNDDVLEYDMMVNENSVCCLRWRPPERVNKRREKFFKE